MRIVTFNLRNHSDRWEERFPLVVETLLETDADLIAFQEVSLKLGSKNQAEIIADAVNERLNHCSYQVFFKEGRGHLKGQEGIAILSRVPVLSAESIGLPKLWRVAQLIKVEIDGQVVGIVNTHLHHEPLHDEKIRYPQAKRVKEWALSQVQPCIIVGDFNAQPDSSTIKLLKDNYSSAYETLHGEEPEFTWPTPLVSESVSTEETEMIDYVFLDDSSFFVKQCDLIGTKPALDDPSLYPSDHYGLVAELIVKK